MRILGISAFYHDSAAALIDDGELVAAAQEERFTRKKHDAHFPDHAIEYCLRQAGVHLDKIDYIAFYDKPWLKFERLIATHLAMAPRGYRSFAMAIPVWLKEKLLLKRLLKREFKKYSKFYDFKNRILFGEHHQSHAASAFFPSPFEEAVILTMDGVGEWTTTSMAIGRGHRLEMIKEIHFPHSLGLLYSAFTSYTGFRVNSGEYKVMGLAPYGVPRYTRVILDNLIDLKADGSFRLNLDYFDYCVGLRMTNDKFAALFGRPARDAREWIDSFHMDIAASVQSVTEEAMLRLTRSAARETRIENLCLAGGVALNCVSNGRVLRDGKFKKIWVQPAAGDAGGAIGAAFNAYHGYQGRPRVMNGSLDGIAGAYLGPEYDQDDSERRLAAAGARFEVLGEQGLIGTVADGLAQGKAVGWHQGRMEFGPRALGARSILADARSPMMQKILNLKIKYRESFRPFAPAVLREDVADWFELDCDSPYMLLVAAVRKERQREMTAAEENLFGIEKLNAIRSEIPAVTHVDYSARIQTVHRETNPRFHALLTAFKERTGCPVLVNTSFNVRSEPIVCTPEDAFRCFMGTEIDLLAVGNCLLRKEEQDPALKRDYRDEFEPD